MIFADSAPSEAAQNNPIILWVLIIGMAVTLISTQIVPKLRQGLDGARRIASDSEEAVRASINSDLNDLKSQLADMQQQLNMMRARQQAHDEVLVVHRRWDLAVMTDPEHTLTTPPPPLYPTQPPITPLDQPTP